MDDLVGIVGLAGIIAITITVFAAIGVFCFEV
jgi:hypothetical protein